VQLDSQQDRFAQSDGLQKMLDALLENKQSVKNVVGGVPTAALGTPVDLVNEVLKPFGMGTENPVMGSRWMQEKAGIDPDAIETILSGFISPDPLDAVKGAGLLASTVRNPQRIFKEGIYKNPQQLAREAEAMVSPESPALKELFNTSRAELSDIAKRKGNRPGEFWQADNPKGSRAAKDIITPQNEDRLLSALSYAETGAPRLVEGMDGWYVLDPFKDAFVDVLGEEQGIADYSMWNALTTMNSPGAPVDWEIPRGSSAYMLNKQGRIDDWIKYAGAPESARGLSTNFPQELRNVPGHVYHPTAHAKPIKKYLEEGRIMSKEPKVPLYNQASEAPEIGFQTNTAIPDAHYSRAVGLGDTRGGSKSQWGKSASGTEMTDIAPWWEEQIAGALGIEAVPAQARTWGLYAPQTGVQTEIGAPKLELIANAIMDTSRREGIAPQLALEKVIRGLSYAGK
jgi:hypothetical protein